MPRLPPPFLLTPAQRRRLSPHFPLSHGIPRMDGRHVLSGIIYVLRYGLHWRDAPVAYGPHRTLDNRFVRWSGMGVFDRIFAAITLAATVTFWLNLLVMSLEAVSIEGGCRCGLRLCR